MHTLHNPGQEWPRDAVCMLMLPHVNVRFWTAVRCAVLIAVCRTICSSIKATVVCRKAVHPLPGPLPAAFLHS